MVSSCRGVFKRIGEAAYRLVSSYPGWCIVDLAFILVLLGLPIVDVSIATALLYGMVLLNRYTNHRMEKDTMGLVDVDRIGMSLDHNQALKKRSATDLIGEYVEDCFNRDVLFFHPLKEADFVDSTTERQMLEELLDSAASNMSPIMVKRLGLYVGEDNVMKIVGRKCLTTITMFVASHNHRIYDTREIKVDANGRLEGKK